MTEQTAGGLAPPHRTTAPEAIIGVRADDMLELPLAKRMVAQYATNERGAPELRLFHGANEISFDEPQFFAFGEALAKQCRFRAVSAAAWGTGYAWSDVQPLLEQLVEAGVLTKTDEAAPPERREIHREQPSPLPPASCPHARSWAEAEEITRELTGRAVELGHLELFIPIFRVAHIAMDADGRQVGEANVFPRALRVEVPTYWSTCVYPGSRYMADKPMNVTALKAMRDHWPQMMAALHRIRTAFLRRFPEAAAGWTVGHLERLATSVLAVPTYQLMKAENPVGSGELHPALSSLFRVTDGLRMVMHHMLFVPSGEPTMSPHDPMTAEHVLDYAERNYSFYSDTGVCAGPKRMVQDFLAVLIDGSGAGACAGYTFDPAVEAALRDVDAATEYALLGLQAYAVTFSLWPLMTRSYERLAAASERAVQGGASEMAAFRDRMAGYLRRLKESPYLAMESWRADREHVYADMYEECGRGVIAHRRLVRLQDAIAPVAPTQNAVTAELVAQLLGRRFGAAAGHCAELAACIMDYVHRTQAILREAAATQACINRRLGRGPAQRPFTAGDMDVHNLLQGSEARRLPYLLDEIASALGLAFAIDAERIGLWAGHGEAVA